MTGPAAMTGAAAAGTPVLSVDDLRVAFSGVEVVHGVSFEIRAGECLAIVGESGSGKSVTARSLLGLAGSGVSAASMILDDRELATARPRDWRGIRGGEIGLVLQDALVSLDPLRPVGREIDDTLRLHTSLTPAQRRRRVIELLESVGMPEAETRARQRSGELSGGLRQRALIASAIASAPRLLIADEPTTALDATVQAQVLALLGELRASGMALLLISHDLAVVREVADRVAVMQHGRIVETGVTRDVLEAPQHDYTRQLIGAVPTGVPRGQRLTTGIMTPTPDVDADRGPLLEVRGIRRSFPRRHAEPLLAVDDVSLTLHRGETLGLVGESGSGKTTVARLMLGLSDPDDGVVLVDGERFSGVPERSRRPRRRMLGAVYQDPLGSFDPRQTVLGILLDAISTADGGDTNATASARVAELLDAVDLDHGVLHRRPLHLSGGQRQRVAIARALAPRPDVIICDEPVSALDVSVQAQVLDLLDDLQAEFGLAYVFISHDLGVVQHMSDRVAVMRDGRIVEEGDAVEVFTAPRHDYTKQLVASAPRLRSPEHP